LANIAKLRKRDREIWGLIVKYVNADASSDAVADNFLALFHACMHWIDSTIGEFADAIPAAFCKEIREANEGRKSTSTLAADCQNDVKQVLQWITQPQKTDSRRATVALTFLRSKVDGIKRVFDVNDKFDPNRRDAAFYVETPIEFPAIVSPICLFIWRQLERYREGDGELKGIIPLGTCKRCGNFFVIKRVDRREFCGDNCRAGFHQDQMTQEQKAERMRKYRAALKEIERKRIRIAKQRKGGQ
jgi:hypothetical protein